MKKTTINLLNNIFDYCPSLVRLPKNKDGTTISNLSIKNKKSPRAVWWAVR